MSNSDDWTLAQIRRYAAELGEAMAQYATATGEMVALLDRAPADLKAGLDLDEMRRTARAVDALRGQLCGPAAPIRRKRAH